MQPFKVSTANCVSAKDPVVSLLPRLFDDSHKHAYYLRTVTATLVAGAWGREHNTLLVLDGASGPALCLGNRQAQVMLAYIRSVSLGGHSGLDLLYTDTPH